MTDPEKVLFGDILVYDKDFGDIAKVVSEKHFSLPQYREIWRAMRSMNCAGVKIDSHTLVNELQNRGTLDKIGGTPYLAQLLDEMRSIMVNPDAVQDHAAAVVDGYVRRESCGLTGQRA